MIFLVVLGAAAQQTAADAGSIDDSKRAAHTNMSIAEEHLRMLSEKLNLSAEQQEKARPLIQNMLEERQSLLRDQSLSSQQRSQKQRALHERADRELRHFLNEDQKKKLDELEAQHRAESPSHARH
jgi:predicted ATP-dependent endonuclease of OLD family